ncbi:hypothetical protein [Chromobacterium vaccinii]|uniref:hypothetical protein n=1 Tax=Chromobacterium vaccinii TaxID=1108595 RepID=UPI000A56C7FC|nr:hypothetical protein [Chromobacterium vaccinii]
MIDSPDFTTTFLGSTYLWAVEVPNPSIIRGRFHAPAGWQAGKGGDPNACRIGVWPGLTIPNLPDNRKAPIATQEVIGTDGIFHLEVNDINFRSGNYIIAYFLDVMDIQRAICTTLTLSNGKATISEYTAIAFAGHEIINNELNIKVNYTSPISNNPSDPTDTMVVYLGDKPASPWLKHLIGFMTVTDLIGPGHNSGTTKVPMSAAMTPGSQYVIEYVPAGDPWAASAYQVITWPH